MVFYIILYIYWSSPWLQYVVDICGYMILLSLDIGCCSIQCCEVQHQPNFDRKPVAASRWSQTCVRQQSMQPLQHPPLQEMRFCCWRKPIQPETSRNQKKTGWLMIQQLGASNLGAEDACEVEMVAYFRQFVSRGKWFNWQEVGHFWTKSSGLDPEIPGSRSWNKGDTPKDCSCAWQQCANQIPKKDTKRSRFRTCSSSSSSRSRRHPKYFAEVFHWSVLPIKRSLEWFASKTLRL